MLLWRPGMCQVAGVPGVATPCTHAWDRGKPLVSNGLNLARVVLGYMVACFAAMLCPGNEKQ